MSLECSLQVYTKNYPRKAFHEIAEKQSEYPNQPAESWHLNYFFTPRTVSFATLATEEFEHSFGWNPDLLLRLGIKARACRSLPNPGRTNSPFFLVVL